MPAPSAELLPWQLLVSCEHATHAIPPRWRDCYRQVKDLLHSHRGWDIGGKETAALFATHFSAPLFLAEVSRLLVDHNRSVHHKNLFSEISKTFSSEDKKEILHTYYVPYRNRVLQEVQRQRRNPRPTLHLSIHSFTPVLDGKERTADIGLLYDPARASEKRLCLEWKKRLNESGYRTRCNYPYRGVADGLATWLRKQFDQDSYLGIEIELNQRVVVRGGDDFKKVQRTLVATLQSLA